MDPYQNTNGDVLGKSDDDDAYDCGLMFSIVMVDADIVPGMESIFCDTSKSTSMGFLPNLTAVFCIFQQRSWELQKQNQYRFNYMR